MLQKLRRLKVGVLSLIALVVSQAAVMADSNDYPTMAGAVKPDVDTQALVSAAVVELVAWWVPIALIAILIAYVRYALRKGKGAPNGAL